jgi:hypothetical protein
MCLERMFTKKERNEVLDKLPNEFTVWKVITDWGVGHRNMYGFDRYTTDCFHMPIHAGEMQFKTNIIKGYGNSYRGGGHFWLRKKDAEEWIYGKFEKIIRCKIKKEWITNMGKQNNEIVVVAKKAIFPKYIGQMYVKDKKK